MNDEDKTEVERVALWLIEDDYGSDFKKIYQLTVQALGYYVPQASEEVRNFLDHIALALLAEKLDTAETEIARAKKHIHHAKYISFIAVVSHEIHAVETRVNALESWRRTTLPELRTRLDAIKTMRDQIKPYVILRRERIEDVAADADEIIQVNAQLEKLLSETADFQALMDNGYAEPGLRLLALQPRFWQVLRWVREHKFRAAVYGALFAISMNLIAALIYGVFIDKRIRDWLEGIKEPAASTTTSTVQTPTTPAQPASPAAAPSAAPSVPTAQPPPPAAPTPSAEPSPSTSIPAPSAPSDATPAVPSLAQPKEQN
jgi:hypothetical protein